MDAEHEAEVQALDEELAELEIEKRQLEQTIPKMRSVAEEDAWQAIDTLEDKNKAQLLLEIEQGVAHASKLTKKKSKLTMKQNEKLKLMSEIDE